MTVVAQRKPFAPLAPRPNPRVAPYFPSGASKRNKNVNALVSSEAYSALIALGLKHGGAPNGSTVGFVTDYLVRTGQFDDLLAAAIAEASKS